MNNVITTDQLMLNEDGSIYHLNLLPSDIADTIILVGDPDRVSLVSQFFDKIEIKKQKREFVTHTGIFKGKRLSVISTGIGLGNIDIVMNEIDALVNINFETRQVNEKLNSLNIIRIGTCGALTDELEVSDMVVSKSALSFDTIMSCYLYHRNTEEELFYKKIKKYFSSLPFVNTLNVFQGDKKWVDYFSENALSGTTFTCGGFYAPQSRQLRAPIKAYDTLSQVQKFCSGHDKIINFEMETAALYGFSKILGHRCCSLSCVLANRITGAVVTDYYRSICSMIQLVLGKVVAYCN